MNDYVGTIMEKLKNGKNSQLDYFYTIQFYMIDSITSFIDIDYVESDTAKFI